MAKKATAVEAEPYTTEDRSNRFRVDRMLRKKGFEIRERKGDNDPVWEYRPERGTPLIPGFRFGKTYLQREVLKALANGGG